MISIDPLLPGAIVEIFGNTISIRGNTAGRTTYEVFLSEEIADIFGQTLGGNQSVEFKVGSAEPALFGPQPAAGHPGPVAERAAAVRLCHQLLRAQCPGLSA